MKRFVLLGLKLSLTAAFAASASKALSNDWSGLHMGMNYQSVVEIVGPPYRKLRAGERMDGALVAGTSGGVYIWRVGSELKSASFFDDHLNGIGSGPLPADCC
jgi:hypothetical protein